MALERFSGSCEPFASVDVSEAVGWIKSIPFEAWPQQGPIPGMLTDTTWHGWDEQLGDCVARLLQKHFPGCRDACWALNAIMPGRTIGWHTDDQCPKDWISRVHVPLMTNPNASLLMDQSAFHMSVGTAYHVNPNKPHSLCNAGETARVHFFFDVLRRPNGGEV